MTISSDLTAKAVDWRRHLHRNPELAFNERETAEFVATHLNEYGLKVHRGLAATGVVGTLTRGTGRRVIGIRADMDALPIEESSTGPYASCRPGLMHACGHDGHVAIALAAAAACSRLADLDGTVHFIFQPAEEIEGGARRMVEEGLFRLFPCDEVYALHNWPTLPLGSCVALDGPMMAAFAVFEIEVRGRGGHAAMPHEGSDCVLASTHLVAALQGIVSRNVDPLQAAVLSVTQIHAGDAWNVIPDRCVIRGSVRWFDDTTGHLVESRISQVANNIAGAFGCKASVRYERRYPATINYPMPASRVRSVAASAALNLRVAHPNPSMASEDFSVMLQAVPGCYLWLGAADSTHEHGLHSSSFDFNDELLPIGASLWVALVREYLAKL